MNKLDGCTTLTENWISNSYEDEGITYPGGVQIHSTRVEAEPIQRPPSYELVIPELGKKLIVNKQFSPEFVTALVMQHFGNK